MFNNKQELKEWISNYIENNGKMSLHHAIKNSMEIRLSILEFTKNLPENSKFNQRCFHILEGIEEIPDCRECKVKKVNFSNRNKEWKYLEFCSTKCASSNKIVQQKLKNSTFEKFGVDNISKSKYFHDLMIKKNQEKYGVDWYQQSVEFKEKSIIACLKKYGFDKYTKTDEFKNRVRETCLEKYGVDWYSKSIEFQDKFKKTSLERYGVAHPMINIDIKNKTFNSISEKYDVIFYFQSEDFKKKSKSTKVYSHGDQNYNNRDLFKSTCITRYGVDSPMKLEEIKNKASKSCLEKYGVTSYTLTEDCRSKSMESKYYSNWFNYKEYKLPSNNYIKIQGYEGFALDILFKNYKEEELFISNKDIKEEIGIINYIMDEKDRIYLPDIYIKTKKEGGLTSKEKRS